MRIDPSRRDKLSKPDVEVYLGEFAGWTPLRRKTGSGTNETTWRQSEYLNNFHF